MDNNGHFTPNSTYDTNRRLILSSLPSNVTSQESLFFNSSIGQEPNRVHATGMCIPGSTSEDCFACLKSACDDLIQNCPNQTNAFSWPGEPNLCYVRYSNTSFSGSAVVDPYALLSNSADINSNLTEFRTIWEDLVVRMINAASTAKSTPSSSSNHYKADVAPVTHLDTIYAVMQCTPDLSYGDCDNCLRKSAREYQSCCGQKQGGVVMRPSCFFRWDLYTYSKAFDNITVASPPPADDQARPTNNREGSKGTSSGVIAGFTVPAVVTVFIMLVVGFVLFWRRDSVQRTQVESDISITATHSPQYDFKTILAATDQFSSSNKLGEGGFGEVYKVIKDAFVFYFFLSVNQMDETSTDGNLVTYAWRLWKNGSSLELVDPAIGRNYQSNEITKCIHIALLCVQDNPIKRPLLSTIILMLTSNTITLPVPRVPRFIPRGRHKLDLESSQPTGKSIVSSVNDVSITDLEPR
ncbi:hypothetical protein Bca4012_023332 [Brassica carinata]